MEDTRQVRVCPKCRERLPNPWPYDMPETCPFCDALLGSSYHYRSYDESRDGDWDNHPGQDYIDDHMTQVDVIK